MSQGDRLFRPADMIGSWLGYEIESVETILGHLVRFPREEVKEATTFFMVRLSALQIAEEHLRDQAPGEWTILPRESLYEADPAPEGAPADGADPAPEGAPADEAGPESELGVTVTTEEKRCTRCGEVKPRSDFARNRTRRNGLQDWCKPCCALPSQPRPEEPKLTRACTVCGQEKLLTQFYSAGRGGLRGECKSCSSELKRAKHDAQQHSLTGERQVCAKCGKEKRVAAFYPGSRVEGGICMSCHRRGLRAEQEPSPAEQEPSPAEQEPSPAEQEPSPAEQEPSPAEQEPSPAEQEPSPAEQEPSPTSPQLCTDCAIDRRTTVFYPGSGTCMSCHRKRERAGLKPEAGMQFCSSCRMEKKLDLFYPVDVGVEGGKCRDCHLRRPDHQHLEAVGEHDCHYVFESPDGPTSKGVCKFCGAEKEESNHNSGYGWGWRGAPPELAQADV